MSSGKPKKSQKLGSSRRYRNRNREIEEKENDDGFPEAGNETHDSEQHQVHTVSENQAPNESLLVHSEQPIIACTNPSTSVCKLSPQPQSQDFKDLLAQPEATSKKRKMGSNRKSNINYTFEGIYEDGLEQRVQLSEGVSDKQGVTVETSIKKDHGKEDPMSKSLSDCLPSESLENESSLLQGKHLTVDNIMFNKNDRKTDEQQHLETAHQSKPMNIFSSELNQSSKAEFSQDLICTSPDFSIDTSTKCNVSLQELDESLQIDHHLDTFNEPEACFPNSTGQKNRPDTTYTPPNKNKEERQDVQMSSKYLLHNNKSSLAEHTVLKTMDDQSRLMFNSKVQEEGKQESEGADTLEGQGKITGVQSASLVKEHEHGTQDGKVIMWGKVNAKASTEDEDTGEHFLEHKDDTLKLTKESIYKEVSVVGDTTNRDSDKGGAPMEPNRNTFSLLKQNIQEVGEEQCDLSEARCWTGESSAYEAIGKKKVDVQHHEEEEKYRAVGMEREVENDDTQSTTYNKLSLSKVSLTSMLDFVAKSELIPAKTLHGEMETSSQTCNLQHNSPGELAIELKIQSREEVCPDQMHAKVFIHRSEDIETGVMKIENNDIKEETGLGSTESFTKEDVTRVNDEKDGMSTFMNEHEMLSVSTNIQDYFGTDQASMVVKEHGIKSPTDAYNTSKKMKLIHETQDKLDMQVYNVIAAPDQKQDMYEESLINPANRESKAEQFESTPLIVHIQQSRLGRDGALTENMRFSHSEKKWLELPQTSLSGLISEDDQEDSFNETKKRIQVQSLGAPISEDGMLSFTPETSYPQSSMSLNITKPMAESRDENTNKSVVENKNTIPSQEYDKTPQYISKEIVHQDLSKLDRQDEKTINVKNICSRVDTAHVVLSDVHEQLANIEVCKIQSRTEIVSEGSQQNQSIFEEHVQNPANRDSEPEQLNNTSPSVEVKESKSSQSDVIKENMEFSGSEKRKKIDLTRKSLRGQMHGEEQKNEIEVIKEEGTIQEQTMDNKDANTGNTEEENNDAKEETNAAPSVHATEEDITTVCSQPLIIPESSSQTTHLALTTTEHLSPATAHPDYKKDDGNGPENVDNRNSEINTQVQTKKKKKIGSIRRPIGRHHAEGEEKEWKDPEITEETEHQTSNLLTETQTIMSEVTCDIHDSTETTEQKQIIKSEIKIKTERIEEPAAILSAKVHQTQTVVSDEVSNAEGLTDNTQTNERAGVNDRKEVETVPLRELELAPIITSIQEGALTEHMCHKVKEHGKESPDKKSESGVTAHSTCGPVELIPEIQGMKDLQMDTDFTHAVGSDQNQKISKEHVETPTNRESEPEQAENTNLLVKIEKSNLSQSDVALTGPEHLSPATEHLDYKKDEGNNPENVDNRMAEINTQTKTKKKKKLGSTRRPHGEHHAEKVEGEWKDPEDTEENEHQNSNLLPDTQSTISEVTCDIHDRTVTTEQKQIASEGAIGTGGIDAPLAISEVHQIHTVLSDEASNAEGVTDMADQNNKEGVNEREGVETVLLNEQELTPISKNIQDLAFTEHVSLKVKNHDATIPDKEGDSDVTTHSTLGLVELIPETQDMKDLQMDTENIHPVGSQQNQSILEEHVQNPANRDSEPEQLNNTSPSVEVKESKSSQSDVIKENLEFSGSEKKKKIGLTRKSLRGQMHGEEQKNEIEVIKEEGTIQKQTMDNKDANTGDTEEENNDAKEETNAAPSVHATEEDITTVCSQPLIIPESSSQTTHLALTATEHLSPATAHPDYKKDDGNGPENVDNRNSEINTQVQTKKKKKIGSTRRPIGRHHAEGEEKEWKDPEITEEIEHQTSNLLTETQTIMSEVTCDIHDSTETTEQKQIIKSEIKIKTQRIEEPAAILSAKVHQIQTVVSDEVSNAEELTDNTQTNERPGVNDRKEAETVPLRELELAPMITNIQEGALTEHMSHKVKDHGKESPDKKSESGVTAHSTCGPVELIPEIQGMKDLQMDTDITHAVGSDQNQKISKEHVETPTNRESEPEQAENTNLLVKIEESKLSQSDVALTGPEHLSPATEHLDYKKDEGNNPENVDNRMAEINTQTKTKKKKKLGSTRRPHGEHHAEEVEGEWKDPEDTEENKHQTSNLLPDTQSTVSEVTCDIHDRTVTTEQKQITSEGAIGTGGIDAPLAISEVHQIHTVLSDEASNAEGLTDMADQNNKEGVNEREGVETVLLNEQELTPISKNIQDLAFTEHVSLKVKNHDAKIPDKESDSDVTTHSTIGSVELIPETEDMKDLQMDTENIHPVESQQNQSILEEHVQNPANRDSEPEQLNNTSPSVEVKESKSSQSDVIKENMEFSGSEKRQRIDLTRKSLRGQMHGEEQKNEIEVIKEEGTIQEQTMDNKDAKTGDTEEENNDAKEETNAAPSVHATEEDITTVCSQPLIIPESSSQTTHLALTTTEHLSPATAHPDYKKDDGNGPENVDNRNSEINTQVQTKRKKKIGSTRRPIGRHHAEGEEKEWKDPEITEEIEHQTSNLLTETQTIMSEVTCDIHDSTETTEQKQIIKSEIKIKTERIEEPAAILSAKVHQTQTVVSDEVSNAEGLTDNTQTNERPGVNDRKEAETVPLRELELAPKITNIQEDALTEHMSHKVKDHGKESPDKKSESGVTAHSTCGPVELILEIQGMKDLQMDTDITHAVGSDQNQKISKEHVETEPEPEQAENTNLLVKIEESKLSQSDVALTGPEHLSPATEHLDYKKDEGNNPENVDNRMAEINTQTKTKKKKKLGSTRRPHGEHHAEEVEGEWKDPEDTEKNKHQTSNLLPETQSTISEVARDIHNPTVTTEQKRMITSEGAIGTGGIDEPLAILSAEVHQIHTVFSGEASNAEGLTDIADQNNKAGVNERKEAETVLLNEHELTPIITNIQDLAFTEHVSLKVKYHGSKNTEKESDNEVNAHSTCHPIELIPETQAMKDLQMITENIHPVGSQQNQNISKEHVENPTNRDSEPEQLKNTSPSVQIKESKSSQSDVIKEYMEFSSSEKKKKIGSTRKSLRGQIHGGDQKNKFKEIIKEENNDTKQDANAGYTENFTEEDITAVCSQQYMLSELPSQTTDVALTTTEHLSPATEYPDFTENTENSPENVKHRNAEIHRQFPTKKKKKFGSTRRPHERHHAEEEEGEWKDVDNTEEIQIIDPAATSNLLTELQSAASELSFDTLKSPLRTKQGEACCENKGTNNLYPNHGPVELISERQVVLEQYSMISEEHLENPENRESELEQCESTHQVVHLKELKLTLDDRATQNSADSISGRRKKIGSTRRSLRVTKEKENIQELTTEESIPTSENDHAHCEPPNIIEPEAEQLSSACKNLEKEQSKQEPWQKTKAMDSGTIDILNPDSIFCDTEARVQQYELQIHNNPDQSEGCLLSEIEFYLNKSTESTLSISFLNPNVSEFSEPMSESFLQLSSSQNPQSHMEPSSPPRRRKMGSSRKTSKNKHAEDISSESIGSKQEQENLDKNNPKNSEPKSQANTVKETVAGTEDIKKSVKFMSEVQTLSQINESSAQATRQVLPEGRRKFGSRRTRKGSHGLGAFTDDDFESNQEKTDDQGSKDDLRVSDPHFILQPERTPISHPVPEHKPGTEEVKKTVVKDISASTEAGLVSLDNIRKTSARVVSTEGRQKIDFEQWNEQIPDFGEAVYNIVMVGNSNVGKTSFIKRLQSGRFIPDYSATIGVDTFVQTVTFGNRTVKLYVWDTAGQERYHSITRQVFHKAQGLLLMYDVTSSQSFHAVRAWISQVQEKASPDVILMLLGNKNDCAHREVQLKEGEDLSKEYNIHFMECSAATGENVSESLKTLALLLVKQRVRKEEVHTTLQPKPQNKKSGCC